jgi:hypothetical protein
MRQPRGLSVAGFAGWRLRSCARAASRSVWGEIAPAALAAKGIRYPDRAALNLTRKRLSQTMAEWGKRGLVRSVGTGKEGSRSCETQC